MAGKSNMSTCPAISKQVMWTVPLTCYKSAGKNNKTKNIELAAGTVIGFVALTCHLMPGKSKIEDMLLLPAYV